MHAVKGSVGAELARCRVGWERSDMRRILLIVGEDLFLGGHIRHYAR